jgi:8-oxo-dGTP pyrophosphatase MutT (NUDIX family)
MAARVLLLDPDDRVLLARWEADGETWWTAPGGGLNPGETHQEAANRELAEEIGLVAVPLGAPIWIREHVYQWKDATQRQRELFYECRVPFLDLETLSPIGPHSPEEVGHRWWSLDEIERATDEVFAPRKLALFLRRLLTEGPPPDPIDVGL